MTNDQVLDDLERRDLQDLYFAYREVEVRIAIERRNLLYRDRWERRLREHRRKQNEQ